MSSPDGIPDAHVGALADALGVDPAWSRKLLAAYGSDLAQAATDWRQDRARTAAKAGIELPPDAAPASAAAAAYSAAPATDKSSSFSGGGESKTASRDLPRPAPAADPAASSFFDFTDRHTSHLSAPSAQSVAWSDRKTPFAEIPEGISMPTSAARAASVAAVEAASSSSSSSLSSSSPPGGGASKSASSSAATTPRAVSRAVHVPVSAATSENGENRIGGGGVSRKNGAIPGYRRPQQSSPRAAIASLSSPSPTGAPAAGVVAYDIVFIMDQLARGKITQDQFDQLNAVLM